MKAKKNLGKQRPEAKIQKAIIEMLLLKGWFVKVMHGGAYQSGMPDLFACHSKYGIRLVEVKLPGMVGSYFTAAQLEIFPKLCANGAGVWVLTGATEKEYRRLFDQRNYHEVKRCKDMGIKYV